MKRVLILMVLVMSMISCEDNKPTLTRAGIMSDDIVKYKMKYPEEVEFEGGYSGNEVTEREFDVFQKFTAKNAFGVKSSYVYKIRMIYKDGDWADKNNWKYENLIIENMSSGEQNNYPGE